MRTISVCAALVFLLMWVAPAQAAACCAPPADDGAEAGHEVSAVQQILDRLQDNAAALTSSAATIEYLFIQDPDLLDSHALRKGNLYYLKSEDRSRVRINFDTLKQDDFEEEPRREVYLFDGVWLTKVDYALEQVDLYQQAPEDKPLDAFDFISHHFPLVGFSGSRQFETEFDVRLAESGSDDPNLILLHLEVRPESRYSKDYKHIDFWIDSTLYLPRRVRALSTQGDIYDIRFLGIRNNLKLDRLIFTIETPSHFRKNVEYLKQEPETKGRN